MKKALIVKSVIVCTLGQYGLRDFIEAQAEQGMPLCEQADLVKEVCVVLEKYHAPQTLKARAQETLALIEDDIEWIRYEADCRAALEVVLAAKVKVNEDCEILFTAPPVTVTECDVLGPQLEDLAFEGPTFGKDRAEELTFGFLTGHHDNAAERERAEKCLRYLELTPRTEFSFGEVQARLGL